MSEFGVGDKKTTTKKKNNDNNNLKNNDDKNNNPSEATRLGRWVRFLYSALTPACAAAPPAA